MRNIRQISPALAKRAQIDLGEVAERVPEDIEKLRIWIEKQPHLKARTNDQFLLAFLRGCKFSLEKAKQKIDFFYTIRASIPELYKNRFVDEKCLQIFRSGIFTSLPKTIGEDGPRVYCLRLGLYDIKKYNMADIMKLQYMLGEIQFNEDDSLLIAGFIEIIDFAGVTAAHALQFDAMLTKKLIVLGEKALPNRPKGFHFINVPKIAETALNLAKSLMSDKLKKRFMIHTSIESLYEYVPRDCLPVEYGGPKGTFKDFLQKWEEQLIAYKEYFEEDVQYGTNENLRVNSLAWTPDTLFGIEGSFRKLNID